MKTNEALLIIDYTNDFVADNGALTCGAPAQALSDSIASLATTMHEQGSWIYFPTDVHKPNDPYHPEAKLYPPHNVRGTWGSELFGSVNDWYQQNQSAERVLRFDKTRYSSFAGTDLDLRLRERRVDTLHLTGVCTDICVLHTAVDAYNKCYNLVVHRDCVATLSKAAQDWALNHFQNCLGAKVVD
ncbi:cysteine hydrolase family protein [Lactobacillus sp. Sy-1]|uniref:cysteine hydrolase family protein n=1 Tax=Lactobacillus sp. Sy-1 TaxID=2109645 RepID=UPI001C58DE1F|nr:isochorismatase family cysteine hydrolase [Lactobacillus sp. Sy-1]MBW1605770.1 cysteine hydrolase [Lactobacillus sp. Sy-1]